MLSFTQPYPVTCKASIPISIGNKAAFWKCLLLNGELHMPHRDPMSTQIRAFLDKQGKKVCISGMKWDWYCALIFCTTVLRTLKYIIPLGMHFHQEQQYITLISNGSRDIETILAAAQDSVLPVPASYRIHAEYKVYSVLCGAFAPLVVLISIIQPDINVLRQWGSNLANHAYYYPYSALPNGSL